MVSQAIDPFKGSQANMIEKQGFGCECHWGPFGGGHHGEDSYPHIHQPLLRWVSTHRVHLHVFEASENPLEDAAALTCCLEDDSWWWWPAEGCPQLHKSCLSRRGPLTNWYMIFSSFLGDARFTLSFGGGPILRQKVARIQATSRGIAMDPLAFRTLAFVKESSLGD